MSSLLAGRDDGRLGQPSAVADVDWDRFAPAFTSARPRPLLDTIPEVRDARKRAEAAERAEDQQGPDTPTGLGAHTTDDYGNARTLLVVRVHSGDPERHELWVDQIVVKAGTITLITGGTMQGEHPNGTAPGETLGTSIQGGNETVLHAGDIVHIPSGVPHQAKIAPGTTVTY